MGEVYLAEDTNLGRKVAVKFLSAEKAADPESRKRFIHEARAQALVSHTNVTSFHEVGEEKDKVFIVMEYIEGQKLSELVKTEKLPLLDVLDLAVQIGEGLQAAHEKGVMHRDINPSNILVTSKRVAKITDFGLATWKGASTITKTGLQMGTDSYMSPEQLEGRKADFRTDIFSFGVVLYELVCSRRPFEGNNRETLFYEILYTQPQPLARFCRGVPEGLERVVMKCLAKKPEERYQSAADLVADLKKEKKSMESGERILPKPKKWLPFLIPAGIGLAVLLFLIFKPFSIEIGTDKESAAAENSLAIMYFENLADPEDKDRTAEMITSLLVTDLSESEYMSVASQQYLYDILKLLGKADLKVINRQVASEVAEKARAKWILTGKVMQTKPNLVVTAEVSETKVGKILTSHRVSGQAGEDLFAIVDKLSDKVKKGLSLPEQAKNEEDKPVANVTTHSAEAYRYYLEGVDFLEKQYVKEAQQNFQKALSYDSTFAMAYLRLAFFQTRPEAVMLMRKALRYSNKATWKEKHHIKAAYAKISRNYLEEVAEREKIVARYQDAKEQLNLLGFAYLIEVGEPQKAIVTLSKAIKLDPLYAPAYDMLAYAYDQVGDFEKAILTVNKEESIAPDALAYSTKGDIYAHHGQLEPAIEAYRKTLAVKPDYYWSLASLGSMYLFKEDYFRAESCFQELSSCEDKSYRSQGKLYLALIPLYQGKLQEVLAVLDYGLSSDKIEKTRGWENAYKYLVKAAVYDEKNIWYKALEEFKKGSESSYNYIDIFYPKYCNDFYVMILTRQGDLVNAQQATESLGNDNDVSLKWQYWYALGWIERTKGNWKAAIENFKKGLEIRPDFRGRFMLAQTYLEANQLGEAVGEFEKALSRYDESRLHWAILAVKAYYLLGLAYEKSGWNNKAIEKYQEFLEIWKNADPGIAEVEDAKQRLAILKKKV